MGAIEFKAIPTFRILDYEKAMEFYINELGFKIDWEHRFGKEEPIYMQISRNGLLLHLSENKRFQTKIIIFVECVGLTEFYDKLIKKVKKIVMPELQKTDWGTFQLEIEDPFGNLLRFNQNIK